jgi:uncharacterized protein
MEPKDFAAITAHLQTVIDGAASTPAAVPHLQTLQAQIDAIARGDLATMLAHATDDVRLEIFAPPEFPWVRAARGAVAFRDAVAQNVGAMADQQPEIRDVFAEGDRVVLFGRETGTIRETGATYDVEFVERFTFRDGCLASVQIVAAHKKPVGD